MLKTNAPIRALKTATVSLDADWAEEIELPFGDRWFATAYAISCIHWVPEYAKLCQVSMVRNTSILKLLCNALPSRAKPSQPSQEPTFSRQGTRPLKTLRRLHACGTADYKSALHSLVRPGPRWLRASHGEAGGRPAQFLADLRGEFPVGGGWLVKHNRGALRSQGGGLGHVEHAQDVQVVRPGGV